MLLLPAAARGAEHVRLVKEFDWTAENAPGECDIRPLFPTPGLGFAVFQGRPGGLSWRTDGTPAGTYVLSDTLLAVGYDGPVSEVAVLGETAYYAAQTQDGGLVLRQTNGTVRGTRVVMPLDDVAQLEIPFHLASLAGQLLILGRYLDQEGIWLSDGTPSGTHLLGKAEGFGSPLVAGNLAFFRASTQGILAEPWVTDGTPAGTHVLMDICSPACSSYAGSFFDAGGSVYFWAHDSSQMLTLWRTDGTAAGTSRLFDEIPSGTVGFPYSLNPVGTRLLFFLGGPGDTSHLWATDGTQEGTVDIYDFPTSDNQRPYYSGGFSGWSAAAGSSLYFIADDGVHGPELWVSDGTHNGTHLVRDITPGEVGTGITLLASSPYGIVMAIDDGVHGVEVWMSDGTSAGTFMVRDICEGPCSSGPGWATVLGSAAVFLAQADRPGGIVGPALWKLDFVTRQTEFVADACAAGCLAVEKSPEIIEGRAVVFSVMAYDGYCRVWRSDGTPSGTFQLVDWAQGPTAGSPGTIGGLVNVNGTLLLDTSPYGFPTLWVSDGTTAGTARSDVQLPSEAWAVSAGQIFGLTNLGWGQPPAIVVTGLDGGTPRILAACQLSLQLQCPSEFQPFRGGVLFGNYDTEHGNELWSSDSTASGTQMVKDIVPGVPGSLPRGFGRTKDAIFFAATTGDQSADLARSDGTTEGTYIVAQGLRPGQLVGTPNRLFFSSCRTDSISCTLRVSDGTRSGTVALGAANPRQLTPFGGGLLCIALSGGLTPTGYELWYSDGTESGTQMLKDVRPGRSSSSPHDIVAAGKHAFFAAASRPGDFELWKTDGTAAGTVMVTDIAPGLAGSNPRSLVSVDGVAYFVASDGEHGAEVWRSDGTASGTSMIADLCPGACSSTPDTLTRIGSTVYFTADDWVHGRALWAIDIGLAEASALDADVGPGEAYARVPIVLQGTPDRQVTVGFETEEGTAHAGTDYVPTSGTLTIAAGSEAVDPITVAVTVRSAKDPAKWFFVNLTEQSGGTVRRSTARVTLGAASESPRLRRHLRNPF